MVHNSFFFSDDFKSSLVPAIDVLNKISSIIAEDPNPLPYPYRNIVQKALVHWEDYQVKIRVFNRSCLKNPIINYVRSMLMRKKLFLQKLITFLLPPV